jgi:hypothetical protein
VEGRFVEEDVLYGRTFCMGGRFVEGRSVEGRLVVGRFVGRTFCSEGRFVEGRFVLVPYIYICSIHREYIYIYIFTDGIVRVIHKNTNALLILKVCDILFFCLGQNICGIS